MRQYRFLGVSQQWGLVWLVYRSKFRRSMDLQHLVCRKHLISKQPSLLLSNQCWYNREEHRKEWLSISPTLSIYYQQLRSFYPWLSWSSVMITRRGRLRYPCGVIRHIEGGLNSIILRSNNCISCQELYRWSCKSHCLHWIHNLLLHSLE